MLCEGVRIKNSEKHEARFINQDGEEIFLGYQNKSTPLKTIITGCNGKYNYLGDFVTQNNVPKFVISNNEKHILTVTRVPSHSPKCKIEHYKRDISVKYSLGLGFTKSSVLENNIELASLIRKFKGYRLEIKDGENPTLFTAILYGAAVINGLADFID